MSERRSESGVYAVALFIFLARTAWTRLVASDLRLIANDGLDLAVFFARGRRALIWSSETQRCRTARRASLLQRLRRLFRDDLQVEERSNRRRIDAVKHLLEQVETLLLVFDQRIFLTVTDESDALFEVIERQQVVLPLRVDDVEHDDALVSAHRFRPDLLFFPFVVDFEPFPNRLDNFRR